MVHQIEHEKTDSISPEAHELVYFINTNVHSNMRISYLESSGQVLLQKKLDLFAENKRPANKLKSTNRHRESQRGFSLDR